MKNSLTEVNKRRDKIIELLLKNPSISTEGLADELLVSPLTIRRDLQSLEKKGVLKRHYGGASLLCDKEESEVDEFDYKEKIAKCAADKITDGDIIFINSSSTALQILKYLDNKNVVVVTNNGKVLEMDFPRNVEILVTGGQLMYKKHSMVGDFAVYALQNVSASKCFLGVSGIDYSTGISTGIMQETLVNTEMIARTSGTVYIVAESSKILKPNNFSSGSIDKIDIFITDENIREIDKQEFENVGVEVIVAK